MAINYLNVFGYLGKELAGWVDISLGDVINAILSFQKFFGIKQSGQLCAKTIRAMELYRCGVPDRSVAGTNSEKHIQRLTTFTAKMLPKWAKTALTYRVANYVNGLARSAQDDIIDKAFALWTNVAALQINRCNSGDCDILVSTGQGQKDNFDGPGGVLAWCYLPDGSDSQLLMEFDLDETWITDSKQRGVLMLNVAAHEFGHALGLVHSTLPGALMAPYYNPLVAEPQQNDDITKVQALYGRPTQVTTQEAPKPKSTCTHTITVVGPVLVDDKLVAE
jgi:hypothetical protein